MINLEINLNDTNLTLPQIVDASQSVNLNGDMEMPQQENTSTQKCLKKTES